MDKNNELTVGDKCISNDTNSCLTFIEYLGEGVGNIETCTSIENSFGVVADEKA